MTSSQNKTVANKGDVEAYLNSVQNDVKRRDSFELLSLMTEITGNPAVMWGTSLVGFGTYHYKYASGREGDFFLTGFAPRKQSLTVYIMPGFSDYQDLLEKLGKHKHSKSCLYINKLDDIDKSVLKRLIKKSVKDMKSMYETD
ncbi:MAG: DUF1801 domain-containing protein [Gammaproteobacteria bacterium]|nr:DUF1801 domain-containing protein [Gammaproteobacteria bacterium]